MALKADEAKAFALAVFVVHDLSRQDLAILVAKLGQFDMLPFLRQVLQEDVGELLLVVSHLHQTFLARDEVTYISTIARNNFEI